MRKEKTSFVNKKIPTIFKVKSVSSSPGGHSSAQVCHDKQVPLMLILRIMREGDFLRNEKKIIEKLKNHTTFRL